VSAAPIDPTCDVCGTPMQHAPVLGAYCPNNKCGEEEVSITLIEDTPPPENGRFVKLSSKSVQIALEEKLRAEQPMLSKVQAKDLFAILADGTTRRVAEIMLQVKHPKPDRRPGPKRTTSNGVELRLASREGVSL
jgi:hypothetical protein